MIQNKKLKKIFNGARNNNILKNNSKLIESQQIFVNGPIKNPLKNKSVEQAIIMEVEPQKQNV